MTSWVALLVLASAAMHAGWNVLIKGRKGDPLAASAGLSIAWVILGAPLLFVVGPPPAEAWPYLLASQVLHLGYFSLLIMGYRRGDLSLVYPIARGVPPLLVTAGAWTIIGERPSLLSGVGVLCIASGVIGIAAAQFDRRAIQLALATALFIAGYTMVDGLGVRTSGGVATYLIWLSTIQGALLRRVRCLLVVATLRKKFGNVEQRRCSPASFRPVVMPSHFGPCDKLHLDRLPRFAKQPWSLRRC